MITYEQKLYIIKLIVLSVIFLIVPITISYIGRNIFLKKNKKSEIGSMLIFSGALIASIWCFRYSISYYEILTQTAEPMLTYKEAIADSFFATLRMFGVEENFSTLLVSVKDLFSGIVSQSSPYFNLGQSSLQFYTCLLTFLAPIAGGAILFEILASVFPKIKLILTYLIFWRKKYFFSDLNMSSIALAHSIYDLNKSILKSPVIVFTDAYVDDGNEKRVELLSEAKSIGAICVKDDISHIRKNRFGSRAFLLIDENESVNLQTLTDISDDYNAPYLKNSEIFYVTNSDAYQEIEQRVSEKLVNVYKFKNDDNNSEMPTFVPVQSYRNLISDLLVDTPLFEPIIDKKDRSELTVTILGTGYIGVEMFLTTYWMGQILDCKLNINIVSNEPEENFWDKIDYINPEIRLTTIPENKILQYNDNGDFSEPYCSVNYICCDAKSSEFINCINDDSDADDKNKNQSIINTDYYFVALGSDELNVSVANTIKRAVGKHHITINNNSKAVIAYVVYDPTVAEILNQKQLFSYIDNTADILMRAVGNYKEVFSADNVFSIKHKESAEKIHSEYLRSKGEKDRAEASKSRMNDDYKYWANISRSKHMKYKMFSMGILYDSAFNFNSINDEEYKKSVETALEKYKKIASGDIKFENDAQKEKHIELLHKMAWLEHRRWNAFTRVKGFRKTDKYDVYAQKTGSYKQMELKLHPCLVECNKNGILADICAEGKIDEKTALMCEDKSKYDLLDKLSYDLSDKELNNYDFKQYDYPMWE